MDILFDVDWAALLLPETPLLETFIRGTAVYIADDKRARSRKDEKRKPA